MQEYWDSMNQRNCDEARIVDFDALQFVVLHNLFSLGIDARRIRQPKPLTFAGRVATFQNSAMFREHKHTV
jgi:hypothetical protein